jgi:hypothetical protein
LAKRQTIFAEPDSRSRGHAFNAHWWSNSQAAFLYLQSFRDVKEKSSHAPRRIASEVRRVVS